MKNSCYDKIFIIEMKVYFVIIFVLRDGPQMFDKKYGANDQNYKIANRK